MDSSSPTFHQSVKSADPEPATGETVPIRIGSFESAQGFVAMWYFEDGLNKNKKNKQTNKNNKEITKHIEYSNGGNQNKKEDVSL